MNIAKAIADVPMPCFVNNCFLATMRDLESPWRAMLLPDGWSASKHNHEVRQNTTLAAIGVIDHC
jgi:hypothetical protein